MRAACVRLQAADARTGACCYGAGARGVRGAPTAAALLRATRRALERRARSVCHVSSIRVIETGKRADALGRAASRGAQCSHVLRSIHSMCVMFGVCVKGLAPSILHQACLHAHQLPRLLPPRLGGAVEEHRLQRDEIHVLLRGAGASEHNSSDHCCSQRKRGARRTSNHDAFLFSRIKSRMTKTSAVLAAVLNTSCHSVALSMPAGGETEAREQATMRHSWRRYAP